MVPGVDTAELFIGRWRATWVLGLGALVSHGFGLSLVPAFLPRIESTFASGFGPLGIAVGSGLVAYAVGGFIASRILDRLGNRAILNATFALTAVSLAVAGWATSPLMIALPVILLGVVAPISWTATTHVASRSVRPEWHGLVMGGAAAGVGLGVIVNGLLLLVFARADAWRGAFATAAVISLLVTIASTLVFRHPIDRPSVGVGMLAGHRSFREVVSDRAGRIVVLSSSVAGIVSYVFMAFLTATAIVEMGVGAPAAGGLLWMMGVVGIVASLSLGRACGRRSPTWSITAIFFTCGAGLTVLTIFWGYPGMVIAAIGVAVLNYPVWGLVAGVATRSFSAPMALRAVSLGLVGAATLSAPGSILAGQWLDRVGSMRLPFALLGALALGVGTWLSRIDITPRLAP